MAAWQFDVMASFEDRGTELPPALRTRAQKLLVKGFGPPRNETPHWQVLEDGSGNLIDLLWSPDGSCELWARIDARTDAEDFLARLVLFLIEIECDLYSPELDRALPGQIDIIKDALQASATWRFALDGH